MVADGGRLIKAEDTVLLIIDVQEKLLAVMSDKEMVRDNTVRLAAFAGQAGLPVVVTEQDKLGPTVAEVRAVLKEYDPVGKITFNCFGEPGFRSRLERAGRKTLVLAGIESHICVIQTALSALDGYRVQVVADAVSSRTPSNRQVALDRMARSGVTVTSTEMFIYELLGRAGTDEFRAALKLVK